jgi:hypothetical protein
MIFVLYRPFLYTWISIEERKGGGESPPPLPTSLCMVIVGTDSKCTQKFSHGSQNAATALHNEKNCLKSTFMCSENATNL